MDEDEFAKDFTTDEQLGTAHPALDTEVNDEENVAIDMYNDREPLTAYEMSTGQTPGIGLTETVAATTMAAPGTTIHSTFSGNCNSVDR